MVGSNRPIWPPNRGFFGHFCFRSYGKFQTWGGCASFSAAPESAVRLVPKEFDMHQAAIYCGGYETAHHALVHCGKLKPGETVLIHGATGAGGLAATQICTALGANVIVTGGSDEKHCGI